MYESTLLIRPRYSISLFNLTATFRLIERCKVVSGLFACWDESAEYNENPQQKSVVFVDTAGTFRPERIAEILGVDLDRIHLLERILVVRALSTHDQVDAVKRLPRYNPRLVIIDDVATLFSSEYVGAARHLALMKHLHDLSLTAIDLNCAVVITNMV